MNRKLIFAATLSLFALSGCAGGFLDLEADAGAAGAEESKTSTQALADRILGVVDGQENRSARVALVVAAFSELAAERVVRYEPDQAAATLGHLAQLRGVMVTFDGEPDPVFVETDLRHATLSLSSVLADVVIGRVKSFAGTVLGGLNLSGLGERAKIAAVQAALGEALVKDLRAAVAKMQEDESTAAGIKAAAVNRIDRNEGRVKAVLGVASVI